MSDFMDKWLGTNEPAPSTNVVPIRKPAEGIHPYAAAIVSSWIDRLQRLKSKPWVQGDAWDTNCYATARKLSEVANSPWSGYDHSSAHADYFNHAPHDSVWDKRQKCWERGAEDADSLPEPDPSDTYEIPPATVLDLMAEDPQAASNAIRNRFPLIDWHELWEQENTDEWIVEPLLPARRLVALFSPPKAGKSLLMLEIAVAIAAGTSVLGTDIERPYRVLYVDFENDPRGDIRTRLQAMGESPSDLDNLCYLSYPTIAKLDTLMGAAELMAIITEYECEVVVIDTISRAVGGEENENDTWLDFYRHTGLALKQAEIACIRLDHTGKDHDKGMRGGSAKYGDVDAVWKLSAVTDDTVRLECTDHRMPIAEKTLVLTRKNTPHLHHEVEIEGRAAAFNIQINDIIGRLDAADVPNDAGRETARKALNAAGVKASNNILAEVTKRRKERDKLSGWHYEKDDE